MLKSFSPSVISGGRLLMGPILMILYLCHIEAHILNGLFLFAALSDGLDGFLARKWECCTPLGAWLDHLADKILVLSSLSILCMQWSIRLLWVLSWAVMLRELIALAARSYPRSAKPVIGEAFSVSILGKMKTILQCVSIALLFSAVSYSSCWLLAFGLLSLFLSTLLAWISLADYLRRLLF